MRRLAAIILLPVLIVGYALSLLIGDESASLEKVGTGCIAFGQPPILSGTVPVQGSFVRVTISGAPKNTFGMHLLGAPHDGITLGSGCVCYVDLSVPLVTLAFNTNSSGSWHSVPLPVSSSPALLGVTFAWQAGIHHPGSQPLGMALTNGLWLTIGY